MPKFEELRFDLDELEDAEVTEGEFSRYKGDIPPAGTTLIGLVTKMWLTETSNEDEMLKVIFQAQENEGDLEEYNGYEVWDNLALIPGAKFRWKPFLDAFGITLGDLKNKMKLEPENDNVGAPVISIGKWTVGEDEAWCKITTEKEKYKGEWKGTVDKWYGYDEATDEEEDEEEPPPPPSRTRTRASAATSAKSSARGSSAAAPARRTRATEPVEDEPEEDEAEEAPAPRRGARTAKAARTQESAPARRSARGRGAATDNDPPF